MEDSLELLEKYFTLTPDQTRKFKLLHQEFLNWNDQINLISRKDTSHLYERHILHSLGIARVMPFKPGTRVLDVGTGGGFPGIPLSILFPDSEFLLVDSIQKKIHAVNAMIESLKLENASAIHSRAEKVKGNFDFVVSRAVTRMKPFYMWINNKIERGGFNELDNGILYLKGGDLEEEMNELKRPYQIFNLSEFYNEEFFETKKVVYVAI